MNEGKGLKVLIGVLLVCVISLSGYIVYYKLFNKSNTNTVVDNKTNNEEKKDENNNDKKDEAVVTKDEEKDKLLKCETSFDGKKYKYYVVNKYEEDILKITNDKDEIVYTYKIGDSFDHEINYFNESVSCNDLKLTMTKLNSAEKDKTYFELVLGEGLFEKVFYIKDNKFNEILDLGEAEGYGGDPIEFYNGKTKETVSNLRIQNNDLYVILVVDGSVVEYKYVFKDGKYSREKVSTNKYTYDKDLYSDMDEV